MNEDEMIRIEDEIREQEFSTEEMMQAVMYHIIKKNGDKIIKTGDQIFNCLTRVKHKYSENFLRLDLSVLPDEIQCELLKSENHFKLDYSIFENTGVIHILNLYEFLSDLLHRFTFPTLSCKDYTK